MAARASYTCCMSDWDEGLTEHSSAKSWIVALVAIGVIGVGFFFAREHILAAQGQPGPDGVSQDDGTKRKKKRKKRKRRRKGKRANTAAGANQVEEDYADYDWEQDFVEDDLVLGDIQSEPDEVIYEEVQERPPPPPYEPTREEWQASGSYTPKAGFAEPGANSNVTTIDLSSRSSNSPLDEVAIRKVLSVRALSPCYDRWVQKIPQMKGRVHMTFVIAGDGHVAAAKVTRSQLRSRVVEKCLVDRARRLRFPRSEGGAKTKFSTHFDFTNR